MCQGLQPKAPVVDWEGNTLVRLDSVIPILCCKPKISFRPIQTWRRRGSSRSRSPSPMKLNESTASAIIRPGKMKR